MISFIFVIFLFFIHIIEFIIKKRNINKTIIDKTNNNVISYSSKYKKMTLIITIYKITIICMITQILIMSIRASIIHSCNNPQIYNINLNKINDFNRPTLEHIFPKSYMSKKSFNDLHNIFSCNGIINNHRSNYKYIDMTDDEFYNNKNDFKVINNTDNYYSSKLKLFIPENESKGIIARSIMYITYEYKYRYDRVISYSNLINWCIKYPPTKEEIYHNNIVFKRQFKRNQFIDLYHKKNYINYITKIFK